MRTDEEREALADEYAESSLRQMGERRGVSWQAMQQILRRHEIPLRSRGGDCRRFQESEA
jgi:hypothetical protein